MGRHAEMNGKNWRLGVAAILLALVIWQFVAAVIIQYPFILPAPTDVLSAFISLLGRRDIPRSQDESDPLRHRPGSCAPCRDSAWDHHGLEPPVRVLH